MPKDLRSWLRDVREELPEEIISIPRTVDPVYESTAVADHLDKTGVHPVILFESVLDQHKQLSPFKLVTGIHSTRKRIGLTFGVSPEVTARDPMAPGKAFSVFAEKRIPPVRVSRDEAPVKANVWTGEQADLTRLPFVTCNEMDAGPYGTLTYVTRDPHSQRYNASFNRYQVKSARRAGSLLVPRHFWSYFQTAEAEGTDLPCAYVIGHHPAFYEGCSRQVSLDEDEYQVIGGSLDEPLRIVESETFGADLMIPADAEIVIE